MRAELYLLFVIILNVFLFWGQVGMNVANPDDPSIFFNYDGSMMKDYDSGNYELKNFEASDMFEEDESADTESNIFSDLFSSMKDWLFSIPGVRYLVGTVNAVPNFLKVMGFPLEVSFAIGYLWHAITVFVFISWAKGGN